MNRMALPPCPDFDQLELAASLTAAGREAFLAQIGDLNFGWSNNESLFIYILMLLLKTDEVSAAIVFSTLNTTRSRLDLVQRLAKIGISDAELKRELDQLVDRFSGCTKIRNEFNHTTFAVGKDGNITHTQSTKLEESRGKLRFGVRRPIDGPRKAELAEAIHELKRINRSIWDILPRLRLHMIKASQGN